MTPPPPVTHFSIYSIQGSPIQARSRRHHDENGVFRILFLVMSAEELYKYIKYKLKRDVIKQNPTKDRTNDETCVCVLI